MLKPVARERSLKVRWEPASIAQSKPRWSQHRLKYVGISCSFDLFTPRFESESKFNLRLRVLTSFLISAISSSVSWGTSMPPSAAKYNPGVPETFEMRKIAVIKLIMSTNFTCGGKLTFVLLGFLSLKGVEWGFLFRQSRTSWFCPDFTSTAEKRRQEGRRCNSWLLCSATPLGLCNKDDIWSHHLFWTVESVVFRCRFIRL